MSVTTKTRVGAILVVFQWNSNNLLSLLNTLLKQVDKVCVLDNGSRQDTGIIAWPNQVMYLQLDGNRGIAYAQNRGFDFFRKENFDAVLLVDQDTSFPDGYVQYAIQQWQALSDQNVQLAAVGPAYVDRKSGRKSKGIRYSCLGGVQRINLSNVPSPLLVDYVIASGSLIPVDTWVRVGGMNEDMFIYWVDIEWGLRAKYLGYQSYLLPDWLIDHSIGQSIFNFFGRKIPIHDEFRQYFIIRNPFLMLNYSLIPWSVRIRTVIDVLFKYVPIYILVSGNKIRTVRVLIRAIGDGLAGRGGNHPDVNNS